MAQNNNYSFNLFDTIDYGGTSAPKFEPEYEPYKAPSRKKADVKKSAPEKTKSTLIFFSMMVCTISCNPRQRIPF